MSHSTGSPVDTPDEIRSKFLIFASNWKAVTGFLGGIVLLGWAGHAVWGSLATRTDVAREHAYSAEQRGVLDSAVRATVKRLDTLDEGNRWRDGTLKAIADKLNVYVPPPPSLVPSP